MREHPAPRCNSLPDGRYQPRSERRSLMQASTLAALASLALGCAAASARADIAYDALTGQQVTTWQGLGAAEVAEDTMLDPGAGLTISAATLRIQNIFGGL